MPSDEPRTPLGRRLRMIRSRIVASGRRLIGWGELDRRDDPDDESNEPEEDRIDEELLRMLEEAGLVLVTPERFLGIEEEGEHDARE